jgi:hypothetical protein
MFPLLNCCAAVVEVNGRKKKIFTALEENSGPQSAPTTNIPRTPFFQGPQMRLPGLLGLLLSRSQPGVLVLGNTSGFFLLDRKVNKKRTHSGLKGHGG